jgi:hypothetical protein
MAKVISVENLGPYRIAFAIGAILCWTVRVAPAQPLTARFAEVTEGLTN